MKPVETHLYDYLKEVFDASASVNVLSQLELHDTVHQKIGKAAGVRISEAVGMLAAGPGGGLKEMDVDIILVCFARVEGKDKRQRQDALGKVFEIESEVAKLFINDPTMGSRVCDVLVRRSSRGYDVLDGEPYAVANVPLLVNPSGARYTE